MAETWICEKHGSEQVGQQECRGCLHDFIQRRRAADMTGDERAAEMRELCGQVTIAFDKLHQRIEELVGRPVFTHEMAAWDELVDEARTWDRATLGDVLSKLPWDKSAVLVNVESGEIVEL